MHFCEILLCAAGISVSTTYYCTFICCMGTASYSWFWISNITWGWDQSTADIFHDFNFLGLYLGQSLLIARLSLMIIKRFKWCSRKTTRRSFRPVKKSVALVYVISPVVLQWALLWIGLLWKLTTFIMVDILNIQPC